MKIGLLGFTINDANLGCNALTYSFLSIVQEICKDKVEICFFGNVADLLDIKKMYPNIEFSNENIRVKDLRFRWIRLFKSCDCVCDITCGDGFSDIYFPRHVFFTTLMKIMVEVVGTPLYLLPQTYGPFKSRFLEGMARWSICHARRLYARDKRSVDYIKSLCNKDAINVTDLAFCLPFSRNTNSMDEKIKVGINVSGLLWNGGFRESNQFGLTVNYRKYINGLIETLQEDSRFTIYLIPHVIERNNDNLDGDVAICKELYQKYRISNLYIARTPIEAKNYICGMDVFLGARMHSTIAAFSSYTPVIPFSYSRKFEGLYENLEYDYIVHGCSDDTDIAIEKTINWIENRGDMKKQIEMSMEKIESYLLVFRKDMEDCLNSLNIKES